jgi:hypothetical protein
VSIAAEPPRLDSLRDEQRSLRARLARLRGRLRLQLTLEFVADLTLVVTATAAVLVLLDWWFRFDRPVRLLWLIVGGLGLLSYLVIRAFQRWRAGRLDDLAIAITLDRYRPGVGQHVVDVLQLPDLLDEPTSAASPAMVRLAVRRACDELAGSDWHRLWNFKRTAAHAGLFAVALLIPVLFGSLAPRAARLSVARWLFGSNERWPQETYLSVVGLGDQSKLIAPRDERFAVEVRSDVPDVEARDNTWLIRGRGEPLVVFTKPASSKPPRSVVLREHTAEATTRDSVMVETSPGQFRYEFPPAPGSSTFELFGGDDWVEPITIERVDRPALVETKVRVKEPGSSYEGFRTVDDPRQHLLFLPDTEVELTLVGSEELKEVQLKVNPAIPTNLKRTDDRTFTARWVLKEATTLEILLTSARSGLASRPTFLSIGLLKDREPRIALKAVGVTAHVTPVATIPLAASATDDIGLAALRLQIDRSTATDEKSEVKTVRQTVALPFTVEKDRPVLDQQVKHDLLLQPDAPKIGALIRIVAEAEDRCVRGAQIGRSGALQFQVVSPDELFYEILIRQRSERAKFITVLDSIEKQTPVLASEPSTEDYVRIMRVDLSATRQLDQIAGRVADSLQEMKLNQVGSPKSHRLLQDGVIDPLRALTAGPMNQLRSVLQTLAGTATTPGATRDVARRLHGEVVTKMRSILEQMSQWESFVDVVNQIAEVIRMEQKVLQATEKARESRTQEVFDEKP